MRSKFSFAAPIFTLFLVGIAAMPAVAAPPEDACKLLTPAQVSAAVGVPVGPGTHVTPTFLKTCTWSPTGSPSKGLAAVTLNLQDSASYGSGKKMAVQMTASQPLVKPKNPEDAHGVVMTPLSGVGDDAYYLAVGRNVGLMVKKGDVAFKVAIYAEASVEEKEAEEKPLAVEVVSKL